MGIGTWKKPETGNWTGFKDDASDGSNWDLNQSRVHNKVNEIFHTTYGSAITETAGPSWIDPKHDKAGNMKLAPRPGDEADANDAIVMVYDAWRKKGVRYFFYASDLVIRT